MITTLVLKVTAGICKVDLASSLLMVVIPMWNCLVKLVVLLVSPKICLSTAKCPSSLVKMKPAMAQRSVLLTNSDLIHPALHGCEPGRASLKCSNTYLWKQIPRTFNDRCTYSTTEVYLGRVLPWVTSTNNRLYSWLVWNPHDSLFMAATICFHCLRGSTSCRHR